MVNKNVLSCLLKDGKEVNAVMLVGRLVHLSTLLQEQHEKICLITHMNMIKTELSVTMYSLLPWKTI